MSVCGWLASLSSNARHRAGVFRCAAATTLAIALGGCALVVPQTESLRTGWPAELVQKAELDSVPFYPQKDYQIGRASCRERVYSSV